MAANGTKLKRRNLNRYRKVYPYLRKRPVYSWQGDEQMALETARVTFTASNSETYKFKQSYASTPTVTAVSVDSQGNGTADVNVYISSVSTTQAVIETSGPFTGEVHIQIMAIGSGAGS